MRCDESSFLVFMALSVSGSFIGACGDGEITAQERSYDDEPASDPLDIDELTPGTNWWDWVEKPDASNTGPSNPGAIQSIGSCPTINSNNTTLENFSCTGQLTISANNVTLRNFRINAGTSWYALWVDGNTSGLLMEDGELYSTGGSGSCAATVRGMGWTGRRLNIHSCDDGLKPDALDTGTPAGDVELTHSFIHDLTGGHGDGVQTFFLANNSLLFQYNNIIGGNTSAFIMHASPASNEVFRIYNNWLSHNETGGTDGYTVYCEPGTEVHNNLFRRNSGYGPMFSYDCGWQGNRWSDDFSLVPSR